MTKRRLNVLLGLLFIYYLVYLVVVLFRHNLAGNWLSPVGALACAAAVFHVYRKTGRRYKNRLLAAWGCFSWFVADAAWLIMALLTPFDPENSALLQYLYCLPNLFFMLAVLLYFLRKKEHWDRLQIYLDIVAIVLVLGGAIYVLFFRDKFDMWTRLDSASITTALYLLTDMAILTSTMMAFLSIKNTHINLTMRLTSAGMMLYGITDIFYVYQFYTDAYIPNSLTDGIYMLSMMFLGVAALIESTFRITERAGERAADEGTPEPLPENVGSHKIWIAVFIPIALYVLEGLDLGEILLFLGILGAHQILSLYAKFYIQKAQMLKQKMEMNEILEARIDERTQELIKRNEELRIISTVDAVTGLFNRRYFLDRLDELIAAATAEERVYLLYMDLDRFKNINDTYGHDIGDRLLYHFAQRLKTVNEEGMVCGRLGGDEFVIAFSGEFSTEDVAALAEGIYSLCDDPIFIDHYALQVSLSIGVANYPQNAEDRSSLMKHADIAMYHAKNNPHHRYAFFNSWISENAKRRNQIEMLLGSVDYDKEFHIYYQPQYRIADRLLIGMEALLRWNNPELGMISPGEFIPIAEETGAILSIGDWVMRRAIGQISEWNQNYGCNLKMGINVSVKQIDGLNFMNTLRRYLIEKTCPPEWIDIEITESSTIANETTMEEMLTALAGLGITISIDDFGTGYSSLSYIKRFDIDKLKIAKQLVDEINDDTSSDMQIIQAIIMIAKAMKLKTIAEGVEDEEQFSRLERLGCDEIQGFLLGKPVPAEIFEAEYIQPCVRKKAMRHFVKEAGVKERI